MSERFTQERLEKDAALRRSDPVYCRNSAVVEVQKKASEGKLRGFIDFEGDEPFGDGSVGIAPKGPKPDCSPSGAIALAA